MNEELERYINRMSSPEEELLAELDRVTHLRAVMPQMMSGHVQGRLLSMLCRMLRPRRILELGTFTGYATLCMAEGLPSDGVIDTIEIDEELSAISQPYFDRSPYGGKIRTHQGAALDVAPNLGEIYDLVFIDADKRQYPDYYRMLMSVPLVGSGSYILADNILWYGKVVETLRETDVQTHKIMEFNELVLADQRVENVIIPLRDGLNLIRVK
ncbi:MAG: O-methyltransferase [Tidjanibacter sp.]|nr:O-methyltransferase [Tidjanibacter sp.]